MRRTPNARRPRHVGDETLSPDSRLGTSLALLVGQNLFPHQNYYQSTVSSASRIFYAYSSGVVLARVYSRTYGILLLSSTVEQYA